MEVKITNKGSKNLTAQIFGGGGSKIKTTNAINPFNIKSITITMKINKSKQIAEFKEKIVAIAIELTSLEYQINMLKIEKHELVLEQKYEKAVGVKKKESQLLNRKEDLLLDMRVCVNEVESIESHIADKQIKKLKKDYPVKSKQKKISLKSDIRDADEMSVGLMNTLFLNGMKTIGDVLKHSAYELSKSKKHFGKKKIAELIRCLEKYNLKLKN